MTQTRERIDINCRDLVEVKFELLQFVQMLEWKISELWELILGQIQELERLQADEGQVGDPLQPVVAQVEIYQDPLLLEGFLLDPEKVVVGQVHRDKVGEELEWCRANLLYVVVFQNQTLKARIQWGRYRLENQ